MVHVYMYMYIHVHGLCKNLCLPIRLFLHKDCRLCKCKNCTHPTYFLFTHNLFYSVSIYMYMYVRACVGVDSPPFLPFLLSWQPLLCVVIAIYMYLPFLVAFVCVLLLRMLLYPYLTPFQLLFSRVLYIHVHTYIFCSRVN